MNKGDKSLLIILLVIAIAVVVAIVAIEHIFNYATQVFSSTTTTSTTSTLTTSIATTTIMPPPFYTIMGYKGNYLIFLTCQGQLCNIQNLNATLRAQAQLIPAIGNATIQSVLSAQQEMENIFPFGLNGSSGLNASELASGSLKQVFHTPIQLLAFNFTFSNIRAYGGDVAYYYTPKLVNGSVTLSLNETIVATQQSSILFITQAHAYKNSTIGETGGLEYFINATYSP